MHTVNSVVDLLAIDTCCIPDADGVRTASYHPLTVPVSELVGGQDYVWVPDLPRSKHDGGTFISPTVPWDGTLASHPDFLAGVGETDPSADGCWVLRNPEEVYVEAYGAVGGWKHSDPVWQDDWHAINAAVNRHLRFVHGSEIHAGIVRLRNTFYYLGQTLNVKAIVDFRGGYSNTGGRNSYVLRFATDTLGLVANRDDTFGDGVVDPVSGDSRSSKISGMCLVGDGTTNPDAHGLWMRKNVLVEEVLVTKFPGNGFHIVATAGSSDPSRQGNANGWMMSHIHALKNGGHGIYVDGADVNAGYGDGVDSTHNTGWGIFDSSFLGNTWVGCHTANNGLGAYKSDNPNARGVFLGCYSEGNQPASQIALPSIVIGGLHGAGIEDWGGFGGDGDDFKIKHLIATVDSTSVHGGSDYEEHFIAFNNVSSLHSRREAGYAGHCSYKADGVTPRPAGSISFRPQSTGFDKQTVIEFYVYDGDGTDSMVRVAHFWGTSDFTPEVDNTTQMGWSGGAWRTLYLNHAPLVPAGAALAANVAPLTTAEQNVATALKGLVRTYTRPADSDGVRHVGVIAEDVVTAFQNEGLSAYDYGVLESGQRDHVRYEELLAFIIAAL